MSESDTTPSVEKQLVTVRRSSSFLKNKEGRRSNITPIPLIFPIQKMLLGSFLSGAEWDLTYSVGSSLTHKQIISCCIPVR